MYLFPMNKKVIILLAAACCITLQSFSQPAWPAITQTAKPWTRWWWQGSAVDRGNLTAAMERYRAAGLGGLEITPIYGVKGYESSFIDFLSPRWMEMLLHTLKEGKRLGLGIDMANATGWPFGGPWVTPEDACRNINFRIWNLKGGEMINDTIHFHQLPFYRSESRIKIDLAQLSYPVATNKSLQLYALDQLRYDRMLMPSAVFAYDREGTVTDITSKLGTDGKLHWTAPEGEWKVMALFPGFHGKLVERAAPGGEGDVIDHFNATALQHYLARFDTAFAGKDITVLRSFFNDSYEVDDARGQANWTKDLLTEFAQRRKYDLRTYLPLLLQRDSSETGRRVLADYRQTISDLLLEHFTIPWHQWAKAKGKMVRNQSHGSPANILDLYAAVDIPETEGSDIIRFKFATSAAHITGKPLASSETATWLNEHFQSSPADVKLAVDKYFVGGVNHIFWHGTNYSPQQEVWPGWLFYAAVHFTPANTFWKDFATLNRYVARCQSFLQQGKPDNDVLLYFPFSDRIMEMGRDLLLHFDGMKGLEGTAFASTGEWLLKKGYAFDIISDKQVQDIQVDGNLLQTGGGGRYRTILVPDVTYMPIETLYKLSDAARMGATVIFCRNLPTSVPGMESLEQRSRQLEDWKRSLSFLPMNSAVRRAVLGKGCLLSGDDPGALLEAAAIQRETMTDKGLQFVRRQYHNGHVYFISNPGNTPVNEWVPLASAEHNAVLYDPMTLEAGNAKARMNAGRLEVWLQLQPGASCIVETTSRQLKGKRYPYYEPAGAAAPVADRAGISFLTGGPVLPQAAGNIPLGSWTDMPGNDVKNFSGSAQYTMSFKKPSVKASQYCLDLGIVHETAEVWLNGKKIAALTGPGFSTVIPAAWLRENNRLAIIVTNGMANRIAYMDKHGIAWKKFYNTNFPARLPQNRDADGIFTAEKWAPKASGLVGPVTIQPLRMMQ